MGGDKGFPVRKLPTRSRRRQRVRPRVQHGWHVASGAERGEGGHGCQAGRISNCFQCSQDSRKEKGSAGQNLDRQLVLVNKSQDEGAAEEAEEYAF